MHLPDHYLDPGVCAASAAVAATALAGGFLRYRRLSQSAALGTTEPALGTIAAAAAGIFAAQMVNYPVAEGTSGHLVGGALAAILLGPWPAMLAMTTVLAVQCFLFADGGAAALGANVLNMAVIAPWVGWGVYRLFVGSASGHVRRMVAAGAAGWVSVMAAAIACSIELAASGTHTFGATLVAMVSVHTAIGLSEALITAAVGAIALREATTSLPLSGKGRESVSEHAFFNQKSTDDTDSRPLWRRSWFGFAIAAVIVIALAPFASLSPDGLDSVAQQLEFHENGWKIPRGAFAPDYAFENMSSAALGTILAGLIGVAACAGVVWGIGRGARRWDRAR